MTHEFTIIASGLDPAAADFEDRFFEAGCDDATLSFQRGLIIAEFDRDAQSLSRAIVSAMRDVQRAGAIVERVEPDHLVSLSEIADRSHLSRQAISLYAKGERSEGFPPPSVKIMSGHPLWDWSAVAAWLYARALISREEAVSARVIREANAALLTSRPADEQLVAALEVFERA